MQPDPDEHRNAPVDDLLRVVLAARPHAADRIVLAALRSAPAGTSRGRVGPVRIRKAVAAAAFLLLVGVVLTVTLYRDPTPHTAPPRGMLSNEGPVAIITMPDYPITIVGPGGRSSPVPAGTVSVELLGEPR